MMGITINSPASSSTTKRYVALLTQAGTAAPVATVLENSLGGTVAWTRNAAGDYRGTLAGVFTVDKTAAGVSVDYATLNSGAPVSYGAARLDGNTIGVASFNITDGALGDNLLNLAAIQILVYP